MNGRLVDYFHRRKTMGCLSLVLAGLLLGALALFSTNSAAPQQSTASVTPVSSSSLAVCLPVGINLVDVVSVEYGGANKVTVDQTLQSLGAQCNAGNKLVDRTGKEIYFYRLGGCGGNAPDPEISQQQADTIAKLKEQYTVVEMTCNPQGLLIP